MIAGMEQRKSRFLLPVLVYLNLFVTFPTLYTWYMSFTDYGLAGVKFIGLTNFRLIFGDPSFQKALANTFLLVLGAVAIEFAVGMIVALILNKKFYGKPFVYWVVLLPLILAPVVVGLTFRILYDPTLGLINYLIGLVGVRGPLWLTDSRIAMLSIILIDTWEWSPFMALLLLSGLQYVPLEILESATVDGASAAKRFRLITLPLMKNIIALALIFRTLDCFNRTFDIIYITTRGGPGNATDIILTLAYRTAFQYLKFGKAAAQSIVLFIAIIVFIIVLRRALREELIQN
jgi:multiple sugar transport system permease protein